MSKLFLLGLIAATVTVVIVSATTGTGNQMYCSNPPTDNSFTPDPNCEGTYYNQGGVKCCCLCNGKNVTPPPSKPPKGAGYYCGPNYCKGSANATTTVEPSDSTTASTASDSTSTSTSTGSTSTSTSTDSTTSTSTSTTTTTTAAP